MPSRRETSPFAVIAAVVALGWALTLAQAAPIGLTENGTDDNTPETSVAPADQALAATGADGPAYPVTGFEFAYLRDDPRLPTQAQLDALVVELFPTPTGYVAPRPSAPGTEGPGTEAANVSVPLGQLDTLPTNQFHASAANHVAASIVRDFNRRGFIGVLVSPDPAQIRVAFTDDGTAVWGDDLRPLEETTLRLIVRTNFVSEMRTVASGDRITDGRRVNHPLHDRVLEHSPVGVGDLVDRTAIDDYLYDLNRHPGRRAAVAVSTGLDPAAGDTVLDYLVAEAKPWTAFVNVTNTGTANTNEFRERFGFFHTQLTDHDDIFSLEYVTAGFEDSQAIFLSYERPFEDHDRLHWRVFGEFQDFEASDVGFPGADFSGTEYRVGGELIWNFWQDGPSFLDLVAGARWETV
ncbi:MAG: hypothetical protein AAFX76_14400, partial [Planctomycetota bacterium]